MIDTYTFTVSFVNALNAEDIGFPIDLVAWVFTFDLH